MSRQSRHLRTLLMIAMVAAVPAACGDSVTGPARGHEGTYVLERVNGATLPYLAEQVGTYRLDIVGGTLTLRADGTYSGAVVSRETNDGSPVTANRPSTGTFTVDGAQ